MTSTRGPGMPRATHGATRVTLISLAAPPSAQALQFGADRADAKALQRLSASRRLGAATVLRSGAAAVGETAAALGLEATVDHALGDRAYGAWAGQTIPAVAEADAVRFAAWLSDPDAAPPGGESARDLIDRASAWLESAASIQGAVVAITHPAMIRACLVAAMAAPPAVWFRLEIGYGTRTELTRNGGRWRVALVNGTLK